MNIPLLCDKYFKTNDIYDIFGIERHASENESEFSTYVAKKYFKFIFGHFCSPL